MKSVLIKIVPDIRRLKNDDSIPLKLRITFKGQRKYYGTGYSVTDDEWKVINSAEAKGKLRKIKNEMSAIETKADKVISNINSFTFKAFEQAFFDKVIKYQTLESAFESYIKKLDFNEQHGTASSYQTAINSLLKFKSNLKFEHITAEFLIAYEDYMLTKGKSSTTVGIYLRSLRTILNMAIEEGVFAKEDYPFNKRKYSIPSGNNTKKALAKNEVEKLFLYEADPKTNCAMAKDFWILSYLCNGINMMDIAKLRWKDLDKVQISFEREKTKRTNRSCKKRIVALRDSYIDVIISQWGSSDSNPESYIFRILSIDDSPIVKRKKVQQFTKVINKWLKRIGKELSFELKLTTYVARHTFATMVIQGGAPIEFAGQSLGHASILTTQKYFSGFDLEAQAHFTSALTNFKKNS